MQIRKATIDDSFRCAEIHIDARKAMTYLPILHTVTEVQTWMRDVVLTFQDVRVAQIDRKIVGYASLSRVSLTNLYIAPDYQGQGVGSALLTGIQAIMPKGFELWTFEQNKAAIRFYERHGCRTLNTTNGSENEERVPARLMQWRPHW